MGFPRPRKWSQGNVNVTGDLRCLNEVKDVATNALTVVRPLLGPWSGPICFALSVSCEVGGAYLLGRLVR